MCRSVIDDCEEANEKASELVQRLSELRPSNELLRYRRFVITHEHPVWDLPGSAPIASTKETYKRFLKFVPQDPNAYDRATATERYVDALEDEIQRLSKKCSLDGESCPVCGRQRRRKKTKV